MGEIFKAYDIRGVYPSELNEELAYKIGRAFVVFLGTREVFIGRDGRKSSPSLFDALVKGVIEQGADVIDAGLCSTPMFYFGASKARAGIMVTASHNPKQYNGFKMCREYNIPICGDSGIDIIKELVEKNQFPQSRRGMIIKKDIMDGYIQHNLKFVKTDKKFKVVVDAGNGMGGYDFPKIFKKLPYEFVPLYCNIDFEFPNHEANPLKQETMKDLQKKVVKEKADIGVALDGDGDRCSFVDEKGAVVASDFATALIGKVFAKQIPGCKILYDSRSSNVVKETIEKNKGKALMCRVGHSFIKKQMRDEDAVFAGELSGHFFFKDSFFTESTFIATAMILNLMAAEKKPLSKLVDPLRKYSQSGEINLEVKDKDRMLLLLEEKYKDASKILHFDGLSVYYKEWWFNVRASNTEPYLRLNLEANTPQLMGRKKKEVVDIIRNVV